MDPSRNREIYRNDGKDEKKKVGEAIELCFHSFRTSLREMIIKEGMMGGNFRLFEGIRNAFVSTTFK